jgi:hypothetical protein
MEIGQNIEEVWLKDKQTSRQANKQTNKQIFIPKTPRKKIQTTKSKEKTKAPKFS